MKEGQVTAMATSQCTYDETGAPTWCPDDDLGPVTNGVIWMLTGVAIFFLAMRLYCKLSTGRRLQMDDWFLIGATVSLESGW